MINWKRFCNEKVRVEFWADYREKKNITSHEYNIELAYPIIDIIPKFSADVDFLIKGFEKVLTDD